MGKKASKAILARDMEIFERRMSGAESMTALAAEYGLSAGRVQQICSKQRSRVLWKQLDEITNGAPFIYRVYVCSPLRAATPADKEENRVKALAYEEEARNAVANIFKHSGNPALNVQVRAFAPHGHISTMLDDQYACERDIALSTGLDIINICDAIAIGGDVISEGMRNEIIRAVVELKAHLSIFLLGGGRGESGSKEREMLFRKMGEITHWPMHLHAYDLTGWASNAAQGSLPIALRARDMHSDNAEDPAMNYQTRDVSCSYAAKRLINDLLFNRKDRKMGLLT